MDITGVITFSSSEVLPFQPSHAPAVTAGCLSPGLDLGAEEILIQLCMRWVEAQDPPSTAEKKKKALKLLLGSQGRGFLQHLAPGGIKAAMGAPLGLAGLPARSRAGEALQLQPASRALGEVFLPSQHHSVDFHQVKPNIPPHAPTHSPPPRHHNY